MDGELYAQPGAFECGPGPQHRPAAGGCRQYRTASLGCTQPAVELGVPSHLVEGLVPRLSARMAQWISVLRAGRIRRFGRRCGRSSLESFLRVEFLRGAAAGAARLPAGGTGWVQQHYTPLESE